MGGCPAGLAARHPSQLYEAALEGLALFLILMRFHDLHLAVVSLEMTLLFAVVWAGGTWAFTRAIGAAARRLYRRKP